MHIQESQLIQNTGAYPFAEVDRLVSELKEKGVTPIDFGVGDPSSPTPDFIIEAGKKGIEKHANTGYPSYIGMPIFREACANYMKRRYDVELNPETEISSTIASKEAIFHFPLGIVNPGDIVIIPTPGYPPMLTGTKFAHAEPFFVGLFEESDFLIDYESIPENIAEKAVILWLNYPNSPTGKTASLDYYKGLITWAKKHNIILAADEGCYHDIYFDEENPPCSILEVGKEGILTFYSLSKRNNMTGWRSGFVAGDSRLVDIFKKVKTNIDSGTPNFIQEGAIAALNNDEHAIEMRKEYEEKQRILLDAFNAVGLPEAKIDATFYVWQKAPEGMSGVDFAKKLLQENIGIVATPGAWISQNDSIYERNPGENYVRFALVPTLEEVKEAAKRIRENF